MKLTKGHIEALRHTEVVANAPLFGAPNGSKKKGQNCLTCGGVIDGTAVTTKDGLYHPACFSCDKCSAPISGPFVRAMDAKYHERCFGCASCGTPLTETFYVHESAAYCRAHFLEASADRCRRCSATIDREFVFGMHDWKYHVGCFRCEVCEKPLEQYFVKVRRTHSLTHALTHSPTHSLTHSRTHAQDEKAFCLEDYLTQFGEDCASCGEKISGAMHAVDGVAAAEGLKWHTECFACCVCAKRLEDEVFFHEGLLYCREDLYNTFASRCKACGETIEGPCVNAMDNVWHPQCFKCRECGILLEGSFMMKVRANARSHSPTHSLAHSLTRSLTRSLDAGRRAVLQGGLHAAVRREVLRLQGAGVRQHHQRHRTQVAPAVLQVQGTCCSLTHSPTHSPAHSLTHSRCARAVLRGQDRGELRALRRRLPDLPQAGLQGAPRADEARGEDEADGRRGARADRVSEGVRE